MSSRAGVAAADELPGWVRRSWTIPLVIGVLATAFGVILLLNIGTSVATLRWLVVGALVLAAVQTFATTSPRRRPRAGHLAGGLYVLGALVVAFWPGLTLRVLVLALGLALVVGGAFHAGASWRRKGTARPWTWGFTLGLLAVIAGLVFLFGNPMISVFLLIVVLACYLIFGGIMLVLLAIAVGRTTGAARR